ncbi:MAG: hypothetical protein KC476_02485 [Cyanobacteria bacterium HKST-UBA06]|nr:hypothetical protein [Cyanobacteria bacterium HKST-UBA04]MCA9806797.1 hypothetical protein [Cyanobacteria bacterium HKST-UBA06]
MIRDWLQPVLFILALMGLMACTPPAHAGLEYYRVDDNAVLHYQKAQRWQANGQPRYAIGEYQSAIRLKPSAEMTAVVYNNMAYCFALIQYWDQAIASAQEAISLQPNNLQFYKMLVKVYHMADRSALAANDMVDQLTANASDDEGWFLLGMLYEDLAYKDYAVEAYQNVVLLAPNSYLSQVARKRLETLNRPG